MKSALLELRIAMAHDFVDRGPNGNLPKECCLVCGLDIYNPVHAEKNINRQKKQGDSHIQNVITTRSIYKP